MKENRMNKMKIGFVPLILFFLVTVTCCQKESVDTLKISRLVNKVGEVPMSDSVHISFKVKNCIKDTMNVRLMPECDCTTVSIEEVILPPREKVSVDASVMLDRVGDFQKYIFVQIEETDEFYSVEISGTAVEESKEQ
jgi:hypothetical protein